MPAFSKVYPSRSAWVNLLAGLHSVGLGIALSNLPPIRMAHSSSTTSAATPAVAPQNAGSGSDPFSRFVNWFSSMGAESSEPVGSTPSKDPFSQLMNRISS